MNLAILNTQQREPYLETYTWRMSDGKGVFLRKWMPEQGKQTVAVVHIAHGMAEHSGRYQWFAEQLTEKGVIVYAHDHRGHGRTAGDPEPLGSFAAKDGWDRVVHDLNEVGDRIRESHPDLPFFLFGHSMGSFLARDYLGRFETPFDGVVLSGTAGPPGMMGPLGLLVARMCSVVTGPQNPCAFLDMLTFGSYGKAFKPLRTRFDWLSRDMEQVDAYIADPLCGFSCSAGFFKDLISGIVKINRTDHVVKTPVDLPIFLFSGSMDPVGNYSSGVETVYQAYLKAGVRDVSIRFYDGGRHEMLNETNRLEVADDVVEWILGHLMENRA